jgi:hypothetical protein
MSDMTITQALREAKIVKKFLGEPWGDEKKITKKEAKIIVENHGLDLSATADDDGSDIWEWSESIKFTRGSFISGIEKFEIWEHTENCHGSTLSLINDTCSCGILVKLASR